MSYWPVSRQKCVGCAESTSVGEIEEGYCAHCREKCPACGDWLMGDMEVIVNGQRTHAACLEDVEGVEAA